MLTDERSCVYAFLRVHDITKIYFSQRMHTLSEKVTFYLSLQGGISKAPKSTNPFDIPYDSNLESMNTVCCIILVQSLCYEKTLHV